MSTRTAALRADQVVAIDSDEEINRLPELDAIADTVDHDVIDKLLRKIKQWIKAEPRRFDMAEWVKTGYQIPKNVRPPCRTAACA